MPSSHPRRLAPAVAFVLTVAACATPSSRDAGGAAPDADRVDSATLVADVSALAADSMEGRLAGSAGGARGRAYMVRRFRALGLAPLFDSLVQPVAGPTQPNARMGTMPLANVVAVVRGTRTPDRYIVLTAHYDHVGVGRVVNGDSIYNGADDNASGSATLLAVGRALRQSPPATSVIIAALDAEERGGYGANGLVRALAGRDVILNVNLDMVSHSTKGELYAAGASHSPFLRPYLDTLASRAPVRLLQGHDTPVPTRQDDWTTQSDHRAFHEAHIPFVYFGVEDHPDYHRPSDEPRTITPGFFVHAAETVVQAIRLLDRNAAAIAAARPPRP